MFRLTVSRVAIRTNGYVFWRERTFQNLESTVRPYLHTEKRTPIGEIARRMLVIRTKYTDTQDFHERTLLRGEYKFFTGKPCDLRAAQVSEMVSFLESAAFFGFWDVSQVDAVVTEIDQRRLLRPLEPEVAVLLVTILPDLRKTTSPLYWSLCDVLTQMAEDLTVEECARVLVGSTAETPDALLLALVRQLRPAVPTLPSGVLVQLLDSLSSVRLSTRSDTFVAVVKPILRELQTHLLTMMEELDPVELAITYAALLTEQEEGCEGDRTHAEVLDHFIVQSDQVCPRSLAIFCTALDASLMQEEKRRGPQALSPALHRALHAMRELAPRIVFLCVDMTPAEMTPVLRVLHHCIVGLERMHCLDDDKDIEPYRRHEYLAELLRELTDELATGLEASAYLSTWELLAIVQLQGNTLTRLSFLGDINGVSASVSRLLAWVPQATSLWRQLSGRVCGCVTRLTVEELVGLLTTHPGVLEGAALTAVLRELENRRLDLNKGQEELDPGEGGEGRSALTALEELVARPHFFSEVHQKMLRRLLAKKRGVKEETMGL